MKDLRKSEEMIKNGFMIIPFPREIAQLLLNHIKQFIHKVTCHSDADLTACVATLSDEEFEKKFQKPFRMFPDLEAAALNQWAEKARHFLGGEKSCISHVSLYETEINPELTLNSLDAFWRCVRPGKPDVGAAHQDFQFWEILKGTKHEPVCPITYDQRWKIWMPIRGCTEKNSLQFIPGSHNEEIPTKLVETKNGIKPCIDQGWLSKNEHRFMTPFKEFSNCCVLFHDLLVHRGVPNDEKSLRISSEFTILLKLAEKLALHA